MCSLTSSPRRSLPSLHPHHCWAACMADTRRPLCLAGGGNWSCPGAPWPGAPCVRLVAVGSDALRRVSFSHDRLPPPPSRNKPRPPSTTQSPPQGVLPPPARARPPFTVGLRPCRHAHPAPPRDPLFARRQGGGPHAAPAPRVGQWLTSHPCLPAPHAVVVPPPLWSGYRQLSGLLATRSASGKWKAGAQWASVATTPRLARCSLSRIPSFTLVDGCHALLPTGGG